MSFNKISSADYTNFSAKDYEDTAAAQDSTLYPSSFKTDAEADEKFFWQNNDWSIQFGAYLQISELGGLIDRKAQYIVGKGYKIKKGIKETLTGSISKMLSKIRGNGLDTFNSIMYNGVRVYTVGGDFYAEQIRNERGELKNLKPLNPSSVRVVGSSKGMVKRYEIYDFDKTANPTILETDEMFHLAYNRMADAIHGQSVINKLMPIIEMRREAMRDLRVVFHRYVKPLLISSVDTDDTTEISNYKAKLDAAMEKGENLVVPKGVVDNIERVSIPQFSTLDPLPWVKLLQEEFIKAEGVPSIVMGISGRGTESEGKMLYLSWQQIVEFNQMFLEEQIKSQLGLDLEFEFPADIAPVLAVDNKKDLSPNSRDVALGRGKNE